LPLGTEKFIIPHFKTWLKMTALLFRNR